MTSMPNTVEHATHVLAGILTDALGRRKRGDLAQAEIDAISALRVLYDLQRRAWRRELAALKGRVSRQQSQIEDLRKNLMTAVDSPAPAV